MEKLTASRKKVLKYVIDFSAREGYSPSCRQIAENFGWASHNAASEHLQRLAREGYLVKTPRGYLPA